MKDIISPHYYEMQRDKLTKFHEKIGTAVLPLKFEYGIGWHESLDIVIDLVRYGEIDIVKRPNRASEICLRRFNL